LLDNVLAQVEGRGKIETQARLEGRNMTMVLAPEKKAPPRKERSERSGSEPDGEAGGTTATDTAVSPDTDTDPGTDTATGTGESNAPAPAEVVAEPTPTE
jgi:hypothetical protein